MSDTKDGWPMTKEFAEGLTAFGARLADGVMALRDVALSALEVAVTTQEVLIITQAKVHYANERGCRPSYWDLHTWAKETGRPNIASFLYAHRGDPRITGLFGSEQPSIEPPEGS